MDIKVPLGMVRDSLDINPGVECPGQVIVPFFIFEKM